MRLAPVSVVLAVGALVLFRLVEAPPLSHDHPVHMFQAWHFWTEMLGRGRLRGWSPFWGFGYPSGELTPFGAEAWVALWRVATLGQLSWMRTYGVAFAGVLMFSALATFAFARRYFGAAAGVLAALLTLVDPGEWAEGGWLWHTTFGVWPVTLAMGFVLFSLAKLSDVLSGSRPKDVVAAGLLMAAALVTHQLPLIVYPIVVPLLVLDRWLGCTRPSNQPAATWLRESVAPQVGRVALACALGGGLAAFYLVPMLARNALTQDLGVLGASREALGQQIVDCHLFGGMWPPLFVLGVLGGGLALRATRRSGLFLPLATLVFVLFASNVAIVELHAERLLPGLIKVEARRALLVARLFFLPLVAHAVVTLLGAGGGHTDSVSSPRASGSGGALAGGAGWTPVASGRTGSGPCPAHQRHPDACRDVVLE